MFLLVPLRGGRDPAAFGAWSYGYSSLNSSTMVTSTATGSPNRVPGRKRHCRAALTASWSSPKTLSSDWITVTS